MSDHFDREPDCFLDCFLVTGTKKSLLRNTDHINHIFWRRITHVIKDTSQLCSNKHWHFFSDSEMGIRSCKNTFFYSLCTEIRVQ